jgi:probable HAF family extracellular repeat protein
MKLVLSLVASAALFTVALTAPAAAQTRYTITDLGVETTPWAVSDSGLITGTVVVPATRKSPALIRAFVWRNGTKTVLGTLGGPGSQARAVNNQGRVVGYSDRSSVSGDYAAFVWDSATGMRDLNAIAGADGRSAASLGWTLKTATAINDSGQILGRGTHTGRTDGCNTYLWQLDAAGNVQVTPVPLGLDPYGDSESRGLNNLGQVSGAQPNLVDPSGPTNYEWAAAMWDAETGITRIDPDAYFMSNAYSLNDFGQAVGPKSLVEGGFRAFFWDSVGGLRDLGTLGGADSNAYTVNNAGQVVGWADTATGGIAAYIWDNVNGMRNLNTLANVGTSWVLKSVRGINNAVDASGASRALLVGTGTFKVKSKLENRGFLLTPQ